MELLLNEIQQLSQREPKTIEQMALKLAEEAGETAQAVLSYQEASGSGYKGLNLEDVKEECVDVLLVTLSLFYQISDEDELQKLLSQKLRKWESKIN
ncbi:MazG-like family protein [Piscibacillus salipiscarius]|uniref:MazG-like family protein n=1 Tax=Piscibacillus salipiscarius TaxID=299480 RepID=A0ABW5QDU9_9BACI|nr:MazG-like family protein [Piscibacillus salipiscarius]